MKSSIGYYSVNDVIYYDKIAALRAVPPGQYPQWHFISETLKLRDTEQEPLGSLLDYYRIRAEQIRKKYDQVILMYSGGIDSTAMLRSFVDNHIPIDGVVSYGSFNLLNAEKLLRNQEIFRVAIPYINALKKSTQLNFPYHLLDDTKFYNFYDDASWVDQSKSSKHFSPEVGLWSQFHRDPWIQQYCEKGTTVIVRGVDKPRIIFENDTWKLVFLDLDTMTLHDPWTKSHDNLFYDFFYWSADLPDLVIKQAHVIKNFFHAWDSNSPLFQALFSRHADVYDRNKYIEWIDPIIYKPYITDQPGESRSYFSLGKSSMANLWSKCDAFMHAASDNQKNNWKSGMQQLANMISPVYYNSQEADYRNFTKNGMIGIWDSDVILGKKITEEQRCLKN